MILLTVDRKRIWILVTVDKPGLWTALSLLAALSTGDRDVAANQEPDEGR